MKSQTAEQTASAAIGAEEVREELEKILGSKYFVNAHKKKEFLRLICDFHLNGRAHELNEYILGYEVFARDNEYNPSGDPIVRVFAHEIRKKLENYYKTEGSSDPIRQLPPTTAHGNGRRIVLRQYPREPSRNTFAKPSMVTTQKDRRILKPFMPRTDRSAISHDDCERRFCC